MSNHCLQFYYINVRGAVKVALVASERFFSRVSFQMSSQITCQNRCIVALVAFRWLFPVWVFKCFLKSSEWRDAMSHWLNLNNFSPEWVFFSNCPPKRVHSRIGCISMTFSSVSFQVFSQIVWMNICKSRWLHLNDFSQDWVFKCLLKLTVRTDA